MGSHGTGIDQSTTDTIPDDVAALYSWANLRGAKYRDYSASRREHRAQVRYRAAQALLERELKAQAEAEASAELAEREARDAEDRALATGTTEPKQSRLAALRTAENAVLKAATDRVEAARRAEAAAHATVLALREQRELVEAKASATEQERIYAESDALRKHLAGPQPRLRIGDSPHVPEPAVTEPSAAPDIESPEPPVGERFAEQPVRVKTGGWRPLSETILGPEEDWHLSHVSADPLSADAYDGAEQARPAWLSGSAASAESQPTAEPQVASSTIASVSATEELSTPQVDVDVGDRHDEPPAPASTNLEPAPTDSVDSVPRWLPLRDVSGSSARDSAPAVPIAPREIRTPLLAVFSLTGGVGATSLVAALGRALSAAGEKITLVDTTSQALLPFYFGGRELRPGLMRTYSPPEGTGEPVSLILHNATHMNGDDSAQQRLAEQIFASAFGAHRLLIDVSPAAIWLLRRWARLKPAVLVPLVPTMDSVIRLESTERLFRELSAPAAEPLLPYYVLNHFDASQPLHLEVRSALARRLGGRLLPFAVDNSPAIAEAVADGMTVLDYAPDAAVAQEYRDIAGWLRGVSPPRAAEAANIRWGEA